MLQKFAITRRTEPKGNSNLQVPLFEENPAHDVISVASSKKSLFNRRMENLRPKLQPASSDLCHKPNVKIESIKMQDNESDDGCPSIRSKESKEDISSDGDNPLS